MLLANQNRVIFSARGADFQVGGANANAQAWANQGGPGACSPGKIWNIILLKWLEMHPKNANIKLIFNCFQWKTKKKTYYNLIF